MKVHDLMNKHPVTCGPDANLAVAAALMFTNDCGALPVVEDGHITGILTDRDVCVALGTRNQTAMNVTVREVATHDVQTCQPDDDIHSAMAAMRRLKVRRLPVVTDGGRLTGMIALNDLVLAAERQHGEVGYEEVMNTAKAVCEHRGHMKPHRALSILSA